MSAPIEHLGEAETHPNTWKKGATCPPCQAVIERARARFTKPTVNFNISRLKADNSGHYTQNEIGKDIVARAKASGTDIQRAR